MSSSDDILNLYARQREMNYRDFLSAGLDDELYRLYRDLSLGEAQKFARMAFDLLETESRLGQEILETLACFVDGALIDVHGALLQRNDLNLSPFLFRAADPVYAAPLIDELIAFDSWSSTSRSIGRMLLTLAWIGGERVEQQFAAWRATPPEWQRKPFIYVSPATYAQEAGWELTPDGKRRDLFFQTSYRLEPSGSKEDASVVKVMHELDETCPACHQPLCALFDFDLKSPKLRFLGLEGERLVVKTCMNCVCMNTIFTDVDWAGGSRWSPENQVSPNDLPPWNFPEYHLQIGVRRRTPFESRPGYGSICSPSQIGGHPMWWQDAEYPVCPSCNRLMMSLAQVEDGDLLGTPGDGAFYIHLCASCRKVATTAQFT